MNQSTQFHLSDDQIDDYLIGDLSEEATSHLAACDPCQVRVASVSAPIESFRAVTLAWGERRSATLPLHAGSYTQPRWSHRLAWAVGAAALAIGIALPVMHRGNGLQPETSQLARSTEPALQPAPGPSAAQPATEAPASHTRVSATPAHLVEASRQREIARDNQMMKAIDRELDASVETPSALGLPADDVRQPVSARPIPMQD